MMFPQVTILKKKRSAIFVNRLGSQKNKCVISVRDKKKSLNMECIFEFSTEYSKSVSYI